MFYLVQSKFIKHYFLYPIKYEKEVMFNMICLTYNILNNCKYAKFIDDIILTLKNY